MRLRPNGKWSAGGEAGTCLYCGAKMTGRQPDACLGYIPGVSFACCGHGDSEKAYVVYGDGHTPNNATRDGDRQIVGTTLYGDEAVAYFKRAGKM